jgi:hypothetical protein
MLSCSMQLQKGQRRFVADKMMDSANISLAGFVVGQLVTDRVQPILILLGLLIYFGAWALAVRLRKGVQD